MAHTKGEWKIRDEHDGLIPIDGWDNLAEESVAICLVVHDNETKITQEDNARLISASPDLLEACEEALEIMEIEADRWGDACDLFNKAIELCKQAINKAEGNNANI